MQRRRNLRLHTPSAPAPDAGAGVRLRAEQGAKGRVAPEMQFHRVALAGGDRGFGLAGLRRHEERDDISTLSEWIRNYLCAAHPHLGRDGPVCQYVKPALHAGKIWLGMAPRESTGEIAVLDAISQARGFLTAAPRAGEGAD